MLYAVAAFYLCYFALNQHIGVQALWVGYMAHLLARTIYLSIIAKKEVFSF